MSVQTLSKRFIWFENQSWCGDVKCLDGDFLTKGPSFLQSNRHESIWARESTTSVADSVPHDKWTREMVTENVREASAFGGASEASTYRMFEAMRRRDFLS
jgi:hypothetical protein